jgi:hypothetical protein
MTAIFLVWNNKGLALAADQNVSMTRTNEDGKVETLWTETESKIYQVPNQKVVIASSGAGTINNIPINGILSQWAADVSPNFSDLASFAESFVKWLDNSTLEDQFKYGFATSYRMERLLKALLTKLTDSPDVEPLTVVENLFDFWESKEFPLLCGPGLNEYVSRYDWTDHSRPLARDFLNRFADYKQSESISTYNIETLENIFNEQFNKIFERSYSAQNDWEFKLKERCIKYVLSYVDTDDNDPAVLMFTGYGNEDWTPTCVILRLWSYDLPLARITLDRINTPNWVWYEDIGQNDQINTFLNGIDWNIESALQKFVSDNVTEGIIQQEHADVFQSRLDELTNTRIESMRNKINSLPVTKLEFIARQFVELESLASFLVENLPSVGGEIDSVVISR